MIARPVPIDVLIHLFLAGEFLGNGKRLPDGARVGAAAADVIDLRDARSFEEFFNETSDVVGVDIVADLFALVAEDLVFATFEVAFDEVGKEAVELNSGVVWTREAAAAQAAGGDAEVAAVFLDHHITGDLGSPEERVLGLINGEVLGDAIRVDGIGVVPAGFQFGQCDGVGPVAVDLVGGHVDERRLRAGLAGGFEQVEGADRVGVEVVERDGGSTVVRRLGGGVDDGVGPDLAQQREDTLAVADVEFVVNKGVTEGFGEPSLVPSGIALRAEKDGALVVVHAVDFPAECGKMDADFRADKAGRAGDEKFFHGSIGRSAGGGMGE